MEAMHGGYTVHMLPVSVLPIGFVPFSLNSLHPQNKNFRQQQKDIS